MLIQTLRPDLRLWHRVRTSPALTSMIEPATRARAAGDWRAAAAAARVDADVDLSAYDSEDAGRLRADLENFAPDLLWWHLPRHRGGTTALIARATLVLATGPIDEDTPLLAVTLPLAPTGPQRLRLSVTTVGSLEGQRWYIPAPYMWDVRRAGEIRAAWGCGPSRPPLLTPSGRPLPAGRIGAGDDEAAATERVYQLLAAGDDVAAWAACGITVSPGDTGALRQKWAPPTSPVGVAADVRRVAEVTGLDTVRSIIGTYLDIGAETLETSVADKMDDSDEVPKFLTSAIPPDLALLHAGLLMPGDLHPLMREALFPALEPHGPAVGAPVRVRCSGAWHTLQVIGGRLTTAQGHSAEDIRREQTLTALGGARSGCFAVEETWLSGAGRLPRDLAAQRRTVFGKVRDGETEWLLDGLAAGTVDPRVRDGNGWTLLHLAQCVDHRIVAPLLLELGLDVDEPDRIGRTPLYLTVMFGGSADLIRYFLDRGADPHRETVHGASVLSVYDGHARRDDLAFIRNYS